MEIKQAKDKFYVGDESTPSAEMTYVVSGNGLIIIDHTYVSDVYKGQGVGKLLLENVVNWARENNKKIVPLCPYAKAQMEKNPEYHDMIHNRK